MRDESKLKKIEQMAPECQREAQRMGLESDLGKSIRQI